MTVLPPMIGEPPAMSLLRTAARFSADELNSRGQPRWVQSDPDILDYSCLKASVLPDSCGVPCDPETEPECVGSPGQAGWFTDRIQVAFECADPSSPDTEREHSDAANALLEIKAPGAVEAGVWSEWMSGPITDITPVGGAVHLLTGLSLLIGNQATAMQSGGVVVHAPAIAAGFLENLGVATRGKGWYDGPAGSKIVPGVGYPRTGPGNILPASDNEMWLVATGPIRFDETAPIRSIVKDPTCATWEWRAEKRVLVDWSECALFAVRVFLPSPGVC